MSTTINTHTLTALEPVKFVYHYNTNEPINGSYVSIGGGWNCFQHEVLKNFKDAAFSKQTCLVLTDIKSLESSLTSDATEKIQVGKMSGTVDLALNGLPISVLNGILYAGSPCGRQTTKAFFTITPLGNSLVELRSNKKNCRN